MKPSYFISWLLAIVPVSGNTLSTSDIFAVDTADKLNSAPSTTDLFTFSTFPAYGYRAVSTASARFILDTGDKAKSDQLQINGDGEPRSGETFTLSLTRADRDVTLRAIFQFMGEVPTWAGIGGSTVFLSDSAPVGATFSIIGYYLNGEGRTASMPMTFTVSAPMLKAVSSVNVKEMPNSDYEVSLEATASGGASPYSYSWDTNNDGIFGDQMGEKASYMQNDPAGGSGMVMLEVTDSEGAKIMTGATVTRDRSEVAGQPIRLRPTHDPFSFKALDYTGQEPFEFDTARKNNGLVVLTHGIRSSGKTEWLTDMATRIHNRFEAEEAGTAPNIMIVDWKEGAMVSGEVQEGHVKAIKAVLLVGSAVQAGISVVKKGFRKVGEFILKTESDELSEELGLLDPKGELIKGSTQVADFLGDLWATRITGKSVGEELGAWLITQEKSVQDAISLDAPIHLIGHSAGGFVMGAASEAIATSSDAGGTNLLIDRVTMLDTPYIFADHFGGQTKPTDIELIISSYIGEIQTVPMIWKSTYGDNSNFRWTGLEGSHFRIGAGDKTHGLIHRWYRRSILSSSEPDGARLDQIDFDFPGFNNSPIVTGMKAQEAARRKSRGSGGENGDEVEHLVGFSTFGAVVLNDGSYEIRETKDAGITKLQMIPENATAMVFQMRYLNSGDGEFLNVRMRGQIDVAIIPNTLLRRDQFTEVSIPLDGFAGSSSELTMTLVSRGQPTGLLEVKDICFLLRTDTDYDGLLDSEEASLGTSPLMADSDSDGIPDWDEINTTQTDPLNNDTDGDQYGDFREFLSGTDPRDPKSNLQILSFKSEGDLWSLEHNVVEGQYYQLQESESLNFDQYDVLTEGAPQSQIMEKLLIEQSPEPKARSFFRIEVVPDGQESRASGRIAPLR